jgi:hypothetical protein
MSEAEFWVALAAIVVGVAAVLWVLIRFGVHGRGGS